MRWGRKSSAEWVDLSEHAGFFLTLLDDTLAWRERLVGELRFGNRNHVRSVSSYQLDFPPALLEAFVDLPETRKANVLLPLTTRAKRPLLNFGIAGPGGTPATLTSRVSSAGLQAQYLHGLAETSPVSHELVIAMDTDLLEAICGFSPGFFNDTFLKDGDGDMSVALAAYLSSGLGFEVAVADVQRWRSKTGEAGDALSRALGEPADSVSSSEEVLLALPRMSQAPGTADEVDEVVERFYAGVRSADQAGDRSFLGVLGEYGRRYEVVVEVEVPLLEPSRIKMEEDLPLELTRSRFGQWVSQEFALGDARSAHLEARSDDSNVEITDYRVADLGEDDASGWLETVRHTREALAIYSAEVNRPYYVTVSIRLGIARSFVLGAYLLCFANLLAIAAVFISGFHGAVGERFAVLAIPTTVAATFVLAREQTALATRLQWLPRAVLAATTFALWIQIVAGLAFAQGEPAGAGRSKSCPMGAASCSARGEGLSSKVIKVEGAR